MSTGLSSYQCVLHRSLAEIPALLQELNLFKKEPFRTLSITNRVISVNSKNFNMKNGHSWKSVIDRLDSDWKIINSENLSYSHLTQAYVER